MITMETDRLVEDYLRRLDEAAAHLQRSRRAELVAEIREHIDTALREEEAAGEAAVRNVLERLGRPEEIVEAAEPPPPSDETVPAGRLEIGALIALLVPFLGWLLGLVLVTLSRAWSAREKAAAAVLVLIPALVPFLGVMAGAERGMEESVPPADDRPVGLETSDDAGLGPIEVALLAFFFLAGLPSALFLGWRLRRHPSARRRAG